MSWQLAAAISITLNIALNLIRRTYSQSSSSPKTFPTAASYLFGVMPLGLVAGLLVFPHHIDWSSWLLFLVAMQGIVMAISTWTGFIFTGRLALAPAQTIGQLTQVVVVLMAWPLLGDKLNTPQLIGAFIILMAAIIAAWAPKVTNQKSFDKKAVYLGIVSATTLAIGLVCERAMLNHMDVGGVYLVAWGGQTISMLLLASFSFTVVRLKKFYKTELATSAKMGLANGLTGLFYVYAIRQSSNISLINSIWAISLPLTVFAAHILLKERDNDKLVWSSVALSTAGLLIMAL